MSASKEEGLEALLNETRTFPPPEGLAKDANAQPGIYELAQADPLAFWEAQARRLTCDYGNHFTGDYVAVLAARFARKIKGGVPPTSPTDGE